VRSPHFEATDVFLAAQTLQHVLAAACDASEELTSVGLLRDPAAVEALASALVSVVKKAAKCIRAAGNAQAQPQPSYSIQELAAYCFTAAVPSISIILLESTGVILNKLAAAVKQVSETAVDDGSATSSSATSSSSGGSSGGSSSSSTQSLQQQQQMHSIVLLAVLLARSLVVLTDAMEAAAAAAGSTAARQHSCLPGELLTSGT
jgi:hypothetical protein